MRVLALLALAVAFPALAQTFPTKPLKIVVGYPPGGSGDFTSRIAADELSRNLGVAVVVENKPGAGGSIAADAVAKSAPDGYTILNSENLVINKVLYKSVTVEQKDFIPVSRIAVGPCIIVLNNDVPVKSMQELIAYAKANPGKLFNAQAGYGSAPHLAATLFESVAGVKFTAVQFKGGGPAAQSVLSGDTQIAFSTAPTVLGFIRAGRLRAVGVSMKNGSPSVPGIPGSAQGGLPEYDYAFSFGLYVPAGTPLPVVRRIHEALTAGLRKREAQERIAVGGMDAAPSASPEAFADELRPEAARFEALLRQSGAKAE
ncbi:MAG TPA: tripartite tricarboxylate transporter substrate binding protein [Burkholderiales bacterium]|nr:tripartite tricarboxylate transporter substrate binding protein [Burkholderiales bacterium]